MKVYIYIFLILINASVIIYLNVRSWDMSRSELFKDPLNWGGAVVVIICYLYLKRRFNEKPK